MSEIRNDTSRPVGGVSHRSEEITRQPTRDGAGVPSRGTAPFDRVVRTLERSMMADEILPAGVLLECASVDALNCYINYVDLRAVITERDPEEDERYISISNQFYTHFHEFGTVIHVVASSARHWWYFCYDIDASDCTLGRVAIERATLASMLEWVYATRVTGKYPVLEIPVSDLRGRRSFQ